MARIGIDTRLNAYRVGGISTYIRRLCLALSALSHNHHITAFRSRKEHPVANYGLPSSVLWTPSHHRWERFALSVELIRHRLDLFHSPDFIPPYQAANKHIITVHDLTFLHYPQYLTAESRRYYNAQIEVAVTHTNHILSDSEATKRDLINMLAVPANKITVHPLGVDESFRVLDSGETTSTRLQYELPESYFLCVGTWEPRKNILGLAQGYQQLIAKSSDAPSLVLVGKPGWLFDDIKKQIDALGLGKKLLWREDVSSSALPSIYNHATAHITTSFYEGFGLPTLEAMACGTVPIVSNISSLPEIVGDVGLQIDPNDPDTIMAAMERVMTDEDWRTEQEELAQERAKQFTWQACAETTLDVYNQVLAG